MLSKRNNNNYNGNQQEHDQQCNNNGANSNTKAIGEVTMGGQAVAGLQCAVCDVGGNGSGNGQIFGRFARTVVCIEGR